MTERFAYLLSHYPTSGHAFLLREVVGLRAVGFDLKVIAIRGADRPAEKMTTVERNEQQLATTVFPVRLRSIWAHMATVVRHPVGYAAGILLALRLAKWSLRAACFNLIYFLEAIVVGFEASVAGCRHIHTHFSSTVALIARRVFDFSLSITIHGPAEFDDVQAFHLSEKVAAAKLIVTISDYGKSQVMRFSAPEHWHKIVVCRLGVDPTWFEPRARPAQPDVFNLISVGRLTPIKAQRLLLDAIEQIVRTGPRLRLRLVGSGPDEEQLRLLIVAKKLQDVVVLEGARNQDELLVMYAESDVFALASFAEGVPVVLMEAMAMQIPCVATWVNGVPELIEDGSSGLLVAPASVERLRAALERLLGDSALRQRLGTAGRQSVLEAYDLRANVQQLATVFRDRIAS
jgi:colanic acid/amylovoran biosynthesis glycosyltransferase